METTAHVQLDTLTKLKNLRTAIEAVNRDLAREGRYVAAEHVDVADMSLDNAITRYNIRTPGHD